MNLSELGLVVFGAVLTWLYSSLRDYRKWLQERRALLLTIHNEIKQIRAAVTIPKYEKDKLFQWPYFSSSLIHSSLRSHILSPKKDRSLIGILVILSKEIDEYNQYCLIAHMMIANSLEKHCYEPNHRDMHTGMLQSLNRVLSTLNMADREFSAVTKQPILEDELASTPHTQLNQESTQSQNIP